MTSDTSWARVAPVRVLELGLLLRRDQAVNLARVAAVVVAIGGELVGGVG
jgi:hypothetical protein